MAEHIFKIKTITKVTHDVLRIVIEKPADYTFSPGQATEVAINKPGWKDERRPFTFTCLPTEDYLEFTIKTYPDHNGVTNQLLQLNPGDELLLHDVWGAITYKGPGVFIAGGAGITPFIAIFRHLHKTNQLAGNQLIFANKTKADIIYEQELTTYLGNSFINILSDEKSGNYAQGRITEEFLKEHIPDFDKKFYVCGPPPMMKAIQEYLNNLGVKEHAVVVEV